MGLINERNKISMEHDIREQNAQAHEGRLSADVILERKAQDRRDILVELQIEALEKARGYTYEEQKARAIKAKAEKDDKWRFYVSVTDRVGDKYRKQINELKAKGDREACDYVAFLQGVIKEHHNLPERALNEKVEECLKDCLGSSCLADNSPNP